MRLIGGLRAPLLLPALIACASCAPAIQPYRWTTDDEAIAELARRSALVHTVEASCSIILRDDAGGDMTLDGALVARQPSELRLRAWKFQHPVFDITAGNDGIWIDAPRHNRDIDAATIGKNIKEAWSLFTGGFLQRELMIDQARSNADQFALIEAQAADGLFQRCIIDRRRLTPVRYEAIGPDGEIHSVIRLDRYLQWGEVIWPRRISFEHGSRRILIDVHEVDFNGEPNAAAFKPPSRAMRLP